MKYPSIVPQHAGLAGDGRPAPGADRFAVSAETSATPMVFLDATSPDWPVVFANDAFVRLTGFPATMVVGEPLSFLFDHVLDPTSKTAIKLAIKSHKCGVWEMRCRRSDWSEFASALVLDDVRDSQNMIETYCLSFIRLNDNSARLIAKNSELHALYERAPGFIAITQGPEHRYAFANAAYRALVGLEHMVGLTVRAHLLDRLGQAFLDLVDQVYRTGEPFVAKAFKVDFLNLETGMTEPRYLDFVQQPVYGPDGKVSGLFCEGYDVTEQHRAAVTRAALQAEMIHISRVNAMNAMSTTLAHELNQPLSAIANYVAGSLQIVDSTPGVDGRIERALLGIREASACAADIIRNVHELTKRREPERTIFELEPAIDECIRLVSSAIPLGIRIEKDLAHGLAMTANRVQIQQVIINLLRNASEAGLPSGTQTITIVAGEEAQDLVVRIIDTGRGVAPEAASKMFSWSQSSKENGMGLGLSICRTIIEAHRGRLWMQCTGNDGTEFRFSVPRAPQQLLPGDSNLTDTAPQAAERS